MLLCCVCVYWCVVVRRKGLREGVREGIREGEIRDGNKGRGKERRQGKGIREGENGRV